MKVLAVSDTHLSSEDIASRSLWPLVMERLGSEEGKRQYVAIRNACRTAFDASMQAAAERGTYDMAVHLGDVTGGWSLGGLIHPSVVSQAQFGRDTLHGLAPVVRFCLGNHDLGYVDPVTGEGGMTVESIAAAEEVFGDLQWAHKEDEHLLLGVTSSLLDYEGNEQALKQRQKDQKEFVGDTLQTHQGPWALFAHDPKTPLHLANEMGAHMDRMSGFVYGDVHDPRIGAVMSWLRQWQRFSSSPESRVLGQAHQVSQVVPSTAPLWWGGHAFKELSVNGSTLKGELVRVPMTEEAKILPTTNPLRALAWMKGF